MPEHHHHHDDDAALAPRYSGSHAHEEEPHHHYQPHHRHGHHSPTGTHRSPSHAYRHEFVRSSGSSSRSRSRSPRRADDSVQHQQQQHHHQQQHHGPYGHDQLSLEERARGYGDHHHPLPPPPSARWHHGHHQNHEEHFNDGLHHHPHQHIRDAPPSSKLIIRGLSPNVTERMIMDALAAFRPLIARIINDKATGESRGFAFVEFPSIEDARQVVLAYTHGPLFLDNRPLAIGFTDNNRPNRWSGGDGDRLQPPLPGGPSRVDWVCIECHGINFARRTVCFKCEAPRAEHAREVPPGQPAMFMNQMGGGGSDGGSGPPVVSPSEPPAPSGAPSAGSGHRQYENESDPPTQVLLVRDLPEHIEEGELHIAFAEFDGVNDIRLIRDRVTNLTRGFGFVEFVDAESAEKALNSCGNLRVHGQQVRVSFARDTRFSKQHSNAPHPHHHHPPSGSGGTHTVTSMAAAALEQAQWSLANGYNGSAQQDGRQNSRLDADVNAFLESAVAEVEASYVERPRKQWPQPFETGGGSYVFASEYSLYYDPDSMCYYDTQSKLYYNAYRGAYYQCLDGAKGVFATFSPFVPPVPLDDAVFAGPSDAAGAAKKPCASPAALSGATGGFSLTLNKKEKKKPIAIHIKTATTAGSSKLKEAFASSSTAVAVGAVTSGMKRKSAEDIAKWSQLQRASKANTDEAATPETTTNRDAQERPASSPSATTPRKPISTEAKSPKSAQKTELDNLVNAVTVEAPICLLCRRKFGSVDLLRKHETLSKLHLENLAKAKVNKEVIAAQYRDMEHERNDRKRQRVPPSQPAAAAAAKQTIGNGPAPSSGTVPTSSQQPKEPTPSASTALESGIGGKMLKMMGWKSGEGLGKHGTGITKPVAAVGNFGNETAGLGARSSTNPPPPIDLSDMASYKERLQQMARARYDSNPRGL